jgi:hypothetical protein
MNQVILYTNFTLKQGVAQGDATIMGWTLDSNLELSDSKLPYFSHLLGLGLTDMLTCLQSLLESYC